LPCAGLFVVPPLRMRLGRKSIMNRRCTQHIRSPWLWRKG
jgi:hypothetical protein